MTRRPIPTLALIVTLASAAGGWAQAPAPAALTPGQILERLESRLLAWDTAKARELYNQLPATLPDREAKAAQIANGRLLAQEKKLDPAIAALRAAATATPGNPAPALHLGEALLRAERAEEAARVLTEVADRARTKLDEARRAGQPADLQQLLALGIARQRLRQVPEAIAALEEARKLAPANVQVAYELGVTRLMARDYAAAMGLLNEALTANPEIAYGYWFRALAAEKVNRKDLLVNDLNRFLALAPESPDAPRARRILDSIR